MPYPFKKQLLCLLASLLGGIAAFSQAMPGKGMPHLENFTPTEYHHYGKIWAIRSAPNGIIYMAADKGLLEYDGKAWNSFKGSPGFTRSLLAVSDSLLFTGSDLDFGFWERNNRRGFEYTSLYPFRNVAQDVSEEFWQVHQQGEAIVFVSSQHLYVYKDEQLVRIAAPVKFTGSFSLSDTLYFADEREGLFFFNGFELEQACAPPQGGRLAVAGLYRDTQGLVLVTRNAGLYRYTSGQMAPIDNELSRKLKEAQVFSFEPIDENHLAFGTVLKGLYISDLDGGVIHHVNRYKGLPSNTILAMHYSPAGKLWLGMDYGVSALALNQHFTTFYDYRGDFGTGYTALLKDETFYLGTNQGLYRSDWAGLNNSQAFFDFGLVPNTTGQVWTLEDINGDLLMGHDRGLFLVKGNSLEQLSDEEGVWTMLPYQDLLLTGNYNGISIFKQSGGRWAFWKKMPLISGSCNQLLLEADGILWVNIPNFGLIRAVLDEALRPADRLIFPETDFEGGHLVLVKDEQGVRLTTDLYAYTFNAAERQFNKTSLPSGQPENSHPLSRPYPSRTLQRGYEFHSIYNGFALKYLGAKAETEAAEPQLIFRNLEAFNNETRTAIRAGEEVPYRLNNFTVDYVVPNRDQVRYQYRLKETGLWSAWSANAVTELIGLSPGEYRFFVRAKVDGLVSDPYSISLRVAAPWYRSGFALFAYLLFLALIIYAVLYWRKRSLAQQAKLLRYQEQQALRLQAEGHKQELLHLEQERLQAEYAQLKRQLRSKTIELAKKAKENEEKGRLLLALKESYEAAQEDTSLAKRKWKDMERLLDSQIKAEDKTFEIQMDELHQAFFKRLKTRFPDLSSNDLRLCAFLRAGISSKEIAEIFNIKPSSFYISRSRLRKKLDLDTEDNLYDFLNGI